MELVGDNKPEMKTRQLHIRGCTLQTNNVFPCMCVLTLKPIRESFIATGNKISAEKAAKEKARTHMCERMPCRTRTAARRDAVTHTNERESTHNKGLCEKCQSCHVQLALWLLNRGEHGDKWERARETESERENACCLHQRLLLRER